MLEKGKTIGWVILAALIVLVGIFLFVRGDQFDVPTGSGEGTVATGEVTESGRDIMQSDNTKHSIPLDEILSGGPGKDGIPSIDDPQFISPEEASEWLASDDIGLGITFNGESRFYPFQILVWHEIVNDEIAGEPLLVTYCPLCQTGIVFEREVDGEEREFGVSGRLWQSNLLMYDRTGDPDTESLWSQVLGEAVVGPQTGEELDIVPSDIVQFGAWREAHPNTQVLSRDTGTVRAYGTDPYGDYYTDNSAVGFGAEFTDNRLAAKALVYGIEIDGQFKAYSDGALQKGETVTDTFAGKSLTIEKNETGEVRITDASGQNIPIVTGFWFSWAAVHPNTDVWDGE